MSENQDIEAPREGTKEARLVQAISRSGKTIGQLSDLMGWQPHTVRAALTRLRKRGYVIEREAKTERSPARFKLRATSP
jgi:predicted ArsR family transcriptional regulator